MGAYYRSMYEDPEFENDVRKLFDQLAPLYDELHAFVRRKLRTHYGTKHFPSSGHIPAHLFGIIKYLFTAIWRDFVVISKYGIRFF